MRLKFMKHELNERTGQKSSSSWAPWIGLQTSNQYSSVSHTRLEHLESGAIDVTGS